MTNIMTNIMTNTTTNTKHTNIKFTAKIRLLRRMQDILEARDTELADSVFNKIESTLQGERGIKYTAKEAGLKERVYELAKFQLAKETAEFNLNAHTAE